MQDKIPDALIAAFERHYSLDWNDPAMRNERLAWRAAWAEATKPCLLQTQEPAAAEQAAWHAGLDEVRAQAAPAAVAVPDERAAFDDFFRKRNGLHPDTNTTFRSDAAEPWRYWQARAALAATPAAWVKPVSELLGHISDVLPDNAFDKIDTAKWNAVSTLVGVATTTAAAAPVVLPEPWPTTDDLALAYEDAFNRKPAGQIWANLVVLVEALHARRALLATATGLPAQATWLQPKDLESLQRFEETASDNQGYDIGKAAATRLAGFGCLQSHGFGVYSITDFGHFVLDDWEQARALPFRTQEERDADHRADIAAAKVSGETPTHYLVDEHYPTEASERGAQAAQGGE